MKKLMMTAASVAFASVLAQAQKEYKLQYTFKKGDVYELATKSSLDQRIIIPAASMDQKTKMTQNTVVQIKAIDVTSTSAKFEAEYVTISSKIESAQVSIITDSEGDTINVAETTAAANKALRAIKRKKFNFTLNKNGTVESVDNIENLWSGLKDAQAKDQYEQSLGKNAFKKAIENIFAYYSTEKVKVNATWKNTSGSGSFLPLQYANEWTLESIAEPAATIVNDAKITTTDSTKAITLMGAFKATSNLKGRQVTKYIVSTTHGWPESSKSYSEIKGNMTLLAGGQVPEDMPMQMEMAVDAESMVKKK